MSDARAGALLYVSWQSRYAPSEQTCIEEDGHEPNLISSRSRPRFTSQRAIPGAILSRQDSKNVAGYGAGSVDDAWTRMIARYLVKYIPGSPNIVVQNMPGAGAMIAANYVYKVAKPDGLTLGGIRGGLYFDQLVGRTQVQFDWPRFTWLGSPTQVEQIIYIRADTPYKTIDDVRKAVVPPKCGATGTSSTGYGTADVAIIAARNRLLKLVREFQNGIDPYAAYHGDLYNIRPLDVVAAEDDLLKLVSQYEDHIRVRL